MTRYLQQRKAMLRKRAMAGVAARERIRMAAAAGEPGWRLVLVVWLAVYAAPDGRRVELHAASERGQWRRCGSERAVRGALGNILWRMRCN